MKNSIQALIEKLSGVAVADKSTTQVRSLNNTESLQDMMAAALAPARYVTREIKDLGVGLPPLAHPVN